MRFFLDTEFIDDGKTIEPISIGIVNGVGDEFYAELQFDEAKVNRDIFVRSHVLPFLEVPREERLTRRAARDCLRSWVANSAIDSEIEFWAYYADYDWVLIAQLFGPMVALPLRFPKLCFDLEQHWRMLGCPTVKPPLPENQHNALADARWNKQFYDAMVPYDVVRTKEST